MTANEWTAEEGLPSDRVLSLALLDSGAGRRAVGRHRRGLARRAGGTWTVYNSRNAGLPSDADRAPVRQPKRRAASPVDRHEHRRDGRPQSRRVEDASTTATPACHSPGSTAWPRAAPPTGRSIGSPRMAGGSPAGRRGPGASFGRGLLWRIENVNLALPTSGPHGSALWVGTNRGLWRWEGGRWAGAPRARLGLAGRCEVLAMLESRTPVRPGPLGRNPLRPGALRRGPMQGLHTGEFRPAGPPVYTLLETREAEGPVLWIGTCERRAGALEAAGQTDRLRYPDLAVAEQLDQRPPRGPVRRKAVSLDRHERRSRPSRSLRRRAALAGAR